MSFVVCSSFLISVSRWWISCSDGSDGNIGFDDEFTVDAVFEFPEKKKSWTKPPGEVNMQTKENGTGKRKKRKTKKCFFFFAFFIFFKLNAANKKKTNLLSVVKQSIQLMCWKNCVVFLTWLLKIRMKKIKNFLPEINCFVFFLLFF